MQNLTDSDIYYLLLSFLSTPIGFLIAVIAYLLLIGLIGLMIGINATCTKIIDENKEILNQKEKHNIFKK